MLRIPFSRKLVITTVLLVFIVISIGIALFFGFHAKKKHQDHYVFSKAAVVTNGKECAEIGKNILMQGGSAADAMIGALFCEGLACPQSMGLGGGFLLTMYTKETGKVITLNARETAPMAATRNMFDGNASNAIIGGRAVAIPGELKGYWELHKKYGRLSWSKIIAPIIQLCHTGTLVTPYLARLLKRREDKIRNIPSLSPILINPATNKTWADGERIKRPQLAKTLKIIAEEGGDALYTGSLAQQFVDDIQNYNGIITMQDMKNYSVKWEEAVAFDFEGLKLYSSPLPGSGVVLSVILNILENFLPNNIDDPLTWHRIIESFKFAYAARTHLGDPAFIYNSSEITKLYLSKEFAKQCRKKINDSKTMNDPFYYNEMLYSNPEDHGTAHLSIIDENGDAISATSTVNLILGGMVRSESTGIILNDEMDDFSTTNEPNAFGLPPSPANSIAPGKRPLSSMCPTIIIDKAGDVQMVVGAAGGSKITTAVASTILRHFKYNEDLPTAVDAKRVHHQLMPMSVNIENGFNPFIIEELKKRNHTIKFVDLTDGFAAVTAIVREPYGLVPFSDLRRNGSVAGIN